VNSYQLSVISYQLSENRRGWSRLSGVTET